MIPKGMTHAKCHICGGRGIIPTPDNSKWQLCPLCHGKGYIITNPYVWSEYSQSKVAPARWF